MSSKTYSFRAECMHDVSLFRANALAAMAWDFFVLTNLSFGEVGVEIESTKTIEELHEIMKLQDDSHVMIQTLRELPLQDNSLNRDYNIDWY